jgi:hypothetical protein
MKNLKHFKLDNSIIKDFDGLMEMHLDYVEELIVSNIPNDSRIMNIVSLCINIKSLIIEGDQMLKINDLLLNICKPDRLERLVLNGVKLPSQNIISKFKNLKMISLNNIQFCDVKGFLKSIENPDKLEGLTLDSVDLARNGLGELSIFTNLRYLNIMHIENCSFSKIETLVENEALKRINIEKNEIQIADIHNILKGDCKKRITLSIPSKNKDVQNKNHIQIEDGFTTIHINSVDLEDVLEKVPLNKIDNMLLFVNEKVDFKKHINKFKKIANITIAIKDTSLLSIEQAELLRDELNIDKVYILDLDGVFHIKADNNMYEIDKYILLRSKINEYINQVSNEKTQIEQVLKLYKLICQTINYDECVASNVEGYNQLHVDKASNLENGLIERQCSDSGFAEIFKNVLLCMSYDANIICGDVRGKDGTFSWNQVKIDGYWYNTDIAMDSRTITNSNVFGKTENYCLVSTEDFDKTHIARIGRPKYCKYTVNSKVINTYFKTGIYKPDGKGSLLIIITQKIKNFFSRIRTKALPAAEQNGE